MKNHKCCPFCGHKARRIRRMIYDGPGQHCNCSNEMCQLHHPRFTDEEWNMRPQSKEDK